LTRANAIRPYSNSFIMAKEKPTNQITIKNKRASFDYELLETFTAGLVLTGTEIKSIRLGKASLVDTFAIVEHGEVWVKNMYVAEYFFGTYNNHAPRRDRKLLLNRKEIRRLQTAAKDRGFTLVPTRLFINERGLAKLVLAIARGKKEYDKRQSIRERDDRREMDRILRDIEAWEDYVPTGNSVIREFDTQTDAHAWFGY